MGDPDLDRKFLKTVGAKIAQAKMIATLHKNQGVLAEIDYWERRHQKLLEKLDGEAAERIVHFPIKPT